MNINSILIYGVISSCWVSIKSEYQCHQAPKDIKICKDATVLKAVTQENKWKKSNNSKLHITDPNLSAIEPEAFATDLRPSTLTLEFANVTLALLPDSFLHLPSLKSLIIKSGFIDEMNKNIFDHLKNLNSLQLRVKLGPDYIFLTKFLTPLEHLKSLKIIDSDLRQITRSTFPNIKAVNTITHLNLENDNINTIESFAFQYFYNVEYISLESNKLTLFPENVFLQISSLKVLNLKKNYINQFHRTSFYNTHLTELYLSNNKLEILPNGIFFDLVNHLKILRLNSNEIKIIEAETFSHLDLKVLDLENNKLTTIGAEMFRDLKVNNLLLSNNNITRVEPNAFGRCNVTVLHLFDVKIEIDRKGWKLQNETTILQKP